MDLHIIVSEVWRERNYVKPTITNTLKTRKRLSTLGYIFVRNKYIFPRIVLSL